MKMKLIEKMKGLKKGEVILVNLDPEIDPQWWFACPKCGNVATEDKEVLTVKNGTLNTTKDSYLHCNSCGGCGLDFKIVDNRVIEIE